MPRSEAFEREINDTYADILDAIADIERLCASLAADGPAPAIAARLARLRAQTDRHFDTLGALYFEDLMD